MDDHDRPLNQRGKRDAPRMGRLLHREDLLPDLVLSSTAARARATAELVVGASNYEGPLEFIRELYGATPEAYVQILSGLDDRCKTVMVVGHNPGLEQLLYTLTGTDPILPTATLAQVVLAMDTWSELDHSPSGSLVNLWRPKDLDSGTYDT